MPVVIVMGFAFQPIMLRISGMSRMVTALLFEAGRDGSHLIAENESYDSL